MRVAEVAQALEISKKRVYQLHHEDKLRGVIVLGHLVFIAAEVEALRQKRDSQRAARSS